MSDAKQPIDGLNSGLTAWASGLHVSQFTHGELRQFNGAYFFGKNASPQNRMAR